MLIKCTHQCTSRKKQHILTHLQQLHNCASDSAAEGKLSYLNCGLASSWCFFTVFHKMLDEDTPRSARSGGYGSPRDDRFFTPRTVARSNSNSNSEEWATPRYETPRFGPAGYSSQSDGEFQTPRTFDHERKIDRKEIYPTLMRRGSHGESPRIYENLYAAPAKNIYHRDMSSKDSGGYSKESYGPATDHYNPGPGRIPAAPGKYPADINEEEEYISLDLAAAGLSEKDVEDVFSYARHGRCEEIERLFSKGLPVDVRDIYGNTVLTIACQNGNKRVAKAVLRRGANINARNHKGNTPLHYCYHCKYYCSLLLYYSTVLYFFITVYTCRL